MKTAVTELPESRVKIDVAVAADDACAQRVDRAARSLAGEMKLPGFRKGKVPPQLVIQRIGREAVVEQALRDSLPEWYERALLESGVTPIGDPKLDVGELPAEGEDLDFTIEVGVRPKAELGDYKGLEVGKAEVEVPDEAVEAELDRLREGFASLTPVERAAAAGDAVVIDFRARSTASRSRARSRATSSIELGAEGLLPEFDAELTGAAAGDERTVEVTFPEDHRARGARRQDRELRGHGQGGPGEEPARPRRRLRLRGLGVRDPRRASRRDPRPDRPRASSSAPRPSSARPPSTPSRRRRSSRCPTTSSTPAPTRCGSGSSASSAARGIDPQTYAQMQGKDRHDLIDDAEEDAERALRREAVLDAVAEAEGIESRRRAPARGARAGRGQERPGRSCSPGCARRAATACCATRSACAWRPTWSPSRRADPDGAGRRARADLDAGEGGRGGRVGGRRRVVAGCRVAGAGARGQARRALDARLLDGRRRGPGGFAGSAL